LPEFGKIDAPAKNHRSKRRPWPEFGKIDAQAKNHRSKRRPWPEFGKIDAQAKNEGTMHERSECVRTPDAAAT
jgi:hypothetical protein